MKWSGFLHRRPAEPKDAQEARGSQELEEQYAAEAARPQSEEGRSGLKHLYGRADSKL
jgi:hypothetical protein